MQGHATTHSPPGSHLEEDRSWTATTSKTHHISDNLSLADARAILRLLADSDALLAQRIVEMAIAGVEDVDPHEVAAALYDELDALPVEEVWDRAGETRRGYVDTDEAADQMIDELLAPYLQEMAHYQRLGLDAATRKQCMGLLLGLWRFERESTSKFKNWAADAPLGFASVIVDAWKQEFPNQEDIKAMRAFLKEELRGWGANLV